MRRLHVMQIIVRISLLACLLLSCSLVLLDRIQIAQGELTSGSFVLYALNDTITSQALPTTQIWYGSASVQIGYDSGAGDDRIGWFRFNLSQAYRGTLTITSATLYIYANWIDYGSGTAYYYLKCIDPTNETWIDSTITWNNQPTRYSYKDSDDAPVNSAPMFTPFPLVAGANSSQGIQALQNAYDNNLSKTYTMKTASTPYMVEWNTEDASGNKPYLVVNYVQDISQGDTTPPPIPTHPESHVLIFYPIADAQITTAGANTNFGDTNTSQAICFQSSGITSDILLKFNLSRPDLIDGSLNTGNYLISALPYDAISITFKSYANFVSSDPSTQGFNDLKGILRTNETWIETLVTWNSRPTYRTQNVSNPQLISKTGWFGYDVISDEDYMRYSLQNNYTYTLVHRVRSDMSDYAFSEWFMREYGSLTSYIEMSVVSDQIVTSQVYVLTFTTAHIIFAQQLGVTPFIAGLLLSILLYVGLVVPVTWCLRDNEGFLEDVGELGFSIGLLTIFLMFGWLHIGIYVPCLVIMILMLGGILD